MLGASRGRVRATIVAAAAAACATVLLAGTATAAGSPGGGSIGDPYYPTDGNTGYDIGHYDLRLSYTPGADKLSGTATILFTPTKDLSRFSLDFRLDASSVLVDNARAQYTARTGKDRGKLVVTPPRDLPKGKQATLVVRYSGVPSTATYYGYQLWQADKRGALAAQEPQICSVWYPCNEHPLDKATYDVSVAAPTGKSVVSNGVLAGKDEQPNGMTRWNWREVLPQATYLTTLAIGDYELHHSTSSGGMPVYTAYDPVLGDSLGAAKASVERTPEIVDFESRYFGPYPFEATGGIVSDKIGFSLEDQTRPVYGAENFDEGSNTGLIAHENAHQWFGDSVSLHGWRNIWLNEGFASYAEWLWSAHQGEGTPQQLMDYYYDQYEAGQQWNVLPGDPGEDNQFDGLAVYDRGAMTLQALRNTVGDTAFFATLKAWPKQHRYGNARIEDFVALAEKESGKDLAHLFDVWLFTKGKPAHTVANGFPASSVRAAAAPARPRSVDQLQRTHRALARNHG